MVFAELSATYLTRRPMTLQEIEKEHQLAAQCINDAAIMTRLVT